MSVSMSMWSVRWYFTNKSVTGAPYSVESYSLSHSWTLWCRVRWLKQCRLEVAAELVAKLAKTIHCRNISQYKLILPSFKNNLLYLLTAASANDKVCNACLAITAATRMHGVCCCARYCRRHSISQKSESLLERNGEINTRSKAGARASRTRGKIIARWNVGACCDQHSLPHQSRRRRRRRQRRRSYRVCRVVRVSSPSSFCLASHNAMTAQFSLYALL